MKLSGILDRAIAFCLMWLIVWLANKTVSMFSYDTHIMYAFHNSSWWEVIFTPLIPALLLFFVALFVRAFENRAALEMERNQNGESI